MDTSLFKPKDDCQTDKVTAAKISILPHSAALSPAGQQNAPIRFSDLEISNKTSCGCTKAVAIVTDVLAPACVKIYLEHQ